MNLLKSAPFAMAMFAMVGCDGIGSATTGPAGPSVAVSYEFDPLADVQVRLHATEAGPVVAQAISAADGIAHFPDTPSPEPGKYFVSLASFGDGGWILDTKYLSPAKSGMTLNPLLSDDSQTIQIPRGAIRPLLQDNRR